MTLADYSVLTRDTMKALVVYYSRSGNTKTVASAISKALHCDLEELIDTKKRSGIFGWLGAGRDAIKENLTTIAPIKEKPGDYDCIVIGTPVWAGTMASAIRTYITHNKDQFKNVAFFLTCGGKSRETMKDMETLCGKKPLGILELITKDMKKGAYIEKIEEFAHKMRT